MLLNRGVGEDFWESPRLQGDPTSPSYRRSVLGIHWKDWCWSWNSNTLTTWCEELTHLKRPWCWESLRAGGEGDDRGWDGWMASPTQWTWVWVNSGSWWWTGRPGVLQSMGSQRVRQDWATKLNWMVFLVGQMRIYFCKPLQISPFPRPSTRLFWNFNIMLLLYCYGSVKNCSQLNHKVCQKYVHIFSVISNKFTF